MAEIELARGDARDVQHYFQQFSAAACGTLWCLNQQTVASSEVPGHAAPPAWLQAEDIIISQNPLTHENRESGVYSLVPTAANVSVHVLEGSGKKLSTGLLQMAPSSCIMLGPDCHDAKFEGLQLKGGSVVCTGTGCTASFTNVTFNACTLVVCNGAQVTLKEPSFAEMGAAAAGLSIFAHGEGTTVHVQGGSIEGGTQGVTVQAGARLAACGLGVSKVSLTAFEVQDNSSHLSLSACKIHAMTPHLQSYNSYGIAVRAGGSAKLEKCQVSKCGEGVVVRHVGSHLAAEGCTLQKNLHSGVVAVDAAEVVVRGCDSTENGEAGFGVTSGARAVLEKCTAATNKKYGVCAFGEGSELEAEGCTLQENGRCGVLVYDAAKVVARGCHSTDNGEHGFAAEKKATMTASDCSVNRCKYTGFAVFSGARAELKKCTAATNCKHGVFARGEGSRLEAHGCTLQKNAQSGVLAGHAAEVVVTGCHSTDNGEVGFGAQIGVRMAANDCSASSCGTVGFAVFCGAVAVLKKCTAATNSLHGVYVSDSSLEAEGCIFQGNSQSGVVAVDTAEVVVSGCHSTHNGANGLRALGLSVMKASGSVVRGNRLTDCCVASGGWLEMHRVEVNGVMTTNTLGTCRRVALFAFVIFPLAFCWHVFNK